MNGISSSEERVDLQENRDTGHGGQFVDVNT